MNRMQRALIGVAVVMLGCGRFKPPLPPEMFAPKPPEALVVTPSSQGVGFSWVASDEDMQAKELNNGRLAMIAVAGMVGQELATQHGLFGA